MLTGKLKWKRIVKFIYTRRAFMCIPFLKIKTYYYSESFIKIPVQSNIFGKFIGFYFVFNGFETQPMSDCHKSEKQQKRIYKINLR